jgi:hypothetical protein
MASEKTIIRLLHLSGGKCEKCESSDNIHAHHIIPMSVGGKDELSNVVLLCANCHHKVHSVMGPTAKLPRGPRENPHARNIRTLIKQGKALTITLPSKWVDLHCLKKGDMVKMKIDKAGNLVISVVKE